MNEIKIRKGFKFIKSNDQDIIRDIKEYFEDPKIFLNKNNQIGIGISSLRQRDPNYNNIRINSSNNAKSLKGININTDMGINLSTIPNYSINQKTINSKEDNSPNYNNNYPINTISVIKEINNNENTNSKYYKNCIFDFKKDNNENNDYINTENNKQNFFNRRSIVHNNKLNLKNLYSIKEDDNNGKSERLSKDINRNKKFILLCKNNENKKNSKELEMKIIKKKKNSCQTKNIKRPLSVGIHYKYKTSNEIIKSYSMGKNREEESKKKGTNDLMPNEVVDKIKIKYLTQEKKLKENGIRCHNDKDISSYLSKKCNKKEDKLLYNNIEDYRIKKQLLDYLESKKNLSERLGDKLWYINLRRPDYLKSPRGVFVTIGKEEKQIWEPIVEFPLNNIEIIKKAETPHKDNINFEKFLKEKNLYPINLFSPNKNNKNNNNKKNKNKMPNLIDMNDMVIKGKNMILVEKDNFLNFNDKLNLTGRKYRVFKDPREFNLKYSKECLYKLDYQYEGLPFNTIIGVNKKNKTPKYSNNKAIFSQNNNKKEKNQLYEEIKIN